MRAPPRLLHLCHPGRLHRRARRRVRLLHHERRFAETLNARFSETVPTDLREAVGITEDNKVFDTVLMGRKTYEMGLPQGIISSNRQLRQYVFSTSLDELPGPDVELVAEDLVEKVRELKAEDGMDIWLCGGGMLAGASYGEIDALILKRHPILIGSGFPLVVGDVSPRVFGLTEQFAVEGGVTISTYEAPRRRPAWPVESVPGGRRRPRSRHDGTNLAVKRETHGRPIPTSMATRPGRHSTGEKCAATPRQSGDARDR